ncbi:MAG: 3-phosphoserine/phosphohydroxythreonine transaminase, partial [Armatimonadetes bacterium]|nr:3-phosphoserine/phosphohydroxythreonine transaminase [Armatimonadota bacterium]
RKAMEQARRVGGVEVIASSKGDAYAMLPDVAIPAPGACYVHITTNNTIEGTQWRVLPESGTTPLIADASSDFLACDRSGSALSMIYAGAQKNAGPAGVTVVAAKRSFLATAREDVPEMLSYRVHEREDSVYNTPPVFGVYIVRLVCKWIEEQGGVAAMEAANKAKADLVYGALDSHPDVYEPTVTVAAHRSHVNLTFRLCDPTREDAFMDGARDRGMVGLRGHRAVGGFRAPMYNAFPMAWAERFADYLEAFARG